MGRKSSAGARRRTSRTELTFNDEDRHEYLTGFHRRKVERRKQAVLEIKTRLKEEQKKVREERHKEYQKLLKERKEALEEADELEDLVTATTESVQYDHPNHTVTVTTISDLDLTGGRLCSTGASEDAEECGEEREDSKEEGDDEGEKMISTVPRKAGEPILSKKVCSLTASLHAHTKQKNRKGQGKGLGRGRDGVGRGKEGATEKKWAGPGSAGPRSRLGRTSKKQRRQRTGKNRRHQD
ncbi:nucleolar protein 12 [Amia ocellicauda]|uniref:nucleolar protein 12 n=1 Tax=Amia ocellicauda TaxID=2972642 RepID=UPI003464DE98